MNDTIFYGNLVAILESLKVSPKDAELCVAVGQAIIEARARLKATQEAKEEDKEPGGDAT